MVFPKERVLLFAANAADVLHIDVRVVVVDLDYEDLDNLGSGATGAVCHVGEVGAGGPGLGSKTNLAALDAGIVVVVEFDVENNSVLIDDSIDCGTNTGLTAGSNVTSELDVILSYNNKYG